MKKKTSQMGRRLLSLLFAAVLLFTTHAATVMAETLQTGTTAEAVDAAGTVSPANPVHHCDKENGTNDTTTWSYVYFGSYPQTEVTGADLTEEVTGADYDRSGDAWVNGTKYRRISKSDTNDDCNFGDSAYRYFQWEPIKWRVLENDGSTLFVMADKGIDCKKYHHDASSSITWEKCMLRSWLNSNFYGTAFGIDEKRAIVSRTVVNEDHPDSGAKGGNDTNDKVYLLSCREAANPDYGFCESYDTKSAGRLMKTSDYAYARGVYTYDSWWLRSPGYYGHFAALVGAYGRVFEYGDFVTNTSSAVVPVLHIDLSSDLWTLVDDGTSGEGGNGGGEEPGTDVDTPANPAHHCDKENGTNDTTTWSYVCFGSYPQTEVIGADLTEAVTGADYDANGDAWVNGTKYRRIRKSDTNYDAYFGDSAYRYFQWERIKWRVLENDGSTLFVVADKGIDCKNYNEEDTSVIWESCTLRSWLNSDFYGMAFDSNEQSAIVSQTVVNEDNQHYETEGGNNTNDKVYLLSIGEAANPDYGFCESYDTKSAGRRMKTSDYAHARGAYTCSDTAENANCWWWLRSPGDGTSTAAYVNYDGDVYRCGNIVCNLNDAVVPALHIDLSSDFWTLVDDGTSGEGGTGDGEEPGTDVDTPANPTHHCTKQNDGTDTTTWSYVYFGSYPQTEITGSDLTEAVTGADYDANGDAWVNGMKYRRIRSSDTNNSDNFGDSIYRYFQWERIKWRVLKNDGSTLFVVADRGIDCKDYNEEYVSVTWENCTLRSWLNSDFYATAFSSKEQNAIVDQRVVNGDNPFYGTEGGNNTNDKVYLLSIGEVTNQDYGFCEDSNTYSASRQMKTSDYAHARGVYTYSDTVGNANCSWWLRSPGYFTSDAADVYNHGSVAEAGNYVYISREAVVPALHIDLSSDLWTLVDDGTSGEGGNGGFEEPGTDVDTPANPSHHCDKENGTNDTTTWSYVYFGSYPQTEVTESDLTAEVTGADYDANGDAWVNGTKYRRIRKSNTNYDAYFGDSAYRYFKWERIKWRVLENDGSTLFVVADKGVDCKNYNEEFASVTWESCTLRSWLNNDFYGTAFDSNEQSAIVSQTVVNEDNPYYGTGTEGGNNTDDKVYLLSIGEVTNQDYGFCESYDTKSAGRWMQVSDYANARGVLSSSISGYDGNCSWWLRSPGFYTNDAAYVIYGGNVNRGGFYVNDGNYAVVPVLHIDLSSDLWTLVDDGTRGEGGNGETGGGTGDTTSPVNPSHHCDREDETKDTGTWSYICFGTYPQTEVKGDDLTAAIKGASYDANGDAWVDGTKYRRISKSDTNDSWNFGYNAYRYFQWERIKWRVLKNDGSTLFVMADKGVDCKNYNEEDTSVTWESCTLRSWLNSDFYGTAFDSNEQSAIVSQRVVNGDNQFYGTEGGNNTNDKVYLLSIGEAINPNYGFCEDYSTYSASRWMQVSDYARARGAYRYLNEVADANCYWWLRSPGNNAFSAANVRDYGYVSSSYVDTSHNAVVPALHINLSSDLWTLVDDGTSGEGGTGEIGDGTDTGNASPDSSGGQNIPQQNGNSSGGQNVPQQNGNTFGLTDASDTSAQEVKVQKISVSAISKKIAAGKKITLSAVIFPENASDARINWKSSNKNYASVNSKGVVTTKKAGAGKSVTITAAAADGSGVKAEIKLKLIRHAVTKVWLKAPKKTLEVGASMKFKATVKTNGKYANKALKWTSSNPSYAAVSSKGKVTAKKAGKGKTVTITATSTDGTNKKAKVKIKIR